MKEVEAVIEGDGRVPSSLGRIPSAAGLQRAELSRISAASVLAKVSRDRQMDRLDALHPLYGFKAHKAGTVCNSCGRGFCRFCQLRAMALKRI